MAQVKSILCRSSSRIIVNDASVSELVGLEDSYESSPKCDFSIDVFLNDIDFNPNLLKVDKWQNRSNNRLNDSEIFSTLLDKCETSTINMAPVAPSAKAVPSFNFDFNSSFSDLLLNDNSDNLKNNVVSTARNDAACDDLSDLLDSCKLHKSQTDDSLSLATLAKSHFLSDSFVHSKGNLNDLSILNILESDDIDCTASYDVLSNVAIQDPVDLNLLNELHCNDSVDQFSKGNIEPVNQFLTDGDISNDNFIEDIDLSFCIKKRTPKDDCFLKSSPESRDSGFDESDTFSSIPSSEDFMSDESTYHTKHAGSVLYNPKPSLLSKALSCKPKSNQLKREKALKAKKELCQKYFMLYFNKLHQKMPVKNDRFVDQSNSCVMNHLIL